MKPENTLRKAIREFMGYRAEKLEEMIVLRAMGMEVEVEEERVSETKTIWRLVPKKKAEIPQ